MLRRCPRILLCCLHKGLGCGVENPMLPQGDWKWVDEAKEGAQQAKWGMVSSQAGDELLLRIDHSSSSRLQPREANSSVVVGLGLLKSYQDVGAASVGCSGSCSCLPSRFELLHNQKVTTLKPSSSIAHECDR